MTGAREVTRCNLEVAAVDIALVQCYTTIYNHLLGSAAPHVIIGAFDDGNTISTSEANRTIFRIVHYAPDARAVLTKV